MPLLRLLFFLLFAPECRAIWCYDSVKKDHCCGDVCYVTRTKHYRHNEFKSVSFKRGCLRGAAYAGFKRKCWKDKYESHCFCDKDLCNTKDANFTGFKKGKLTCESENGQEKNCVACRNLIHTIGGEKYGGCNIFESRSIDWLMQPQSCTRFELDEYVNRIDCLCDTGHRCDDKLIAEQTLKSTAVTCIVGNTRGVTGNTCQGDLCYISKNDGKIEQGCITNNETLYPRLYQEISALIIKLTVYDYQEGYVTSVNDESRLIEYVMCESNNCNDKWETATSSVNITAPVCDPATTIGYEVRTTSAEDKYEETTTSVSEHDEMEAHFVGEWSKMINKIANVFNDIFAGFGGFHG